MICPTKYLYKKRSEEIVPERFERSLAGPKPAVLDQLHYGTTFYYFSFLPINNRSKERKVLDIADYISHTLAFRHSADALFDHINNLKDPKPIINFKGVEFMGASFAHQYITNKTLTKKYIIEINKNSNVVEMFSIVERRRAKAREQTINLFEIGMNNKNGKIEKWKNIK